MVSWWQMQTCGVAWSLKPDTKLGPSEGFPQPHKLPAARERNISAYLKTWCCWQVGLLWLHAPWPCLQDKSQEHSVTVTTYQMWLLTAFPLVDSFALIERANMHLFC